MKIINLLPKPRQQELSFVAMLRGFWIVFGLTLASFAVVFLAQLGTKFYLGVKSGSLNKEIGQLQDLVNKKENAEIKQKIKAANDIVADYKSLADSSPKWSKVIKAFVVLPPEGVKINSFTADIATKKVMISGSSPTRELVIKLYENILKDTKNFENVDYPLEHVARPLDVSFHFNFFVKDELLK